MSRGTVSSTDARDPASLPGVVSAPEGDAAKSPRAQVAEDGEPRMHPTNGRTSDHA